MKLAFARAGLIALTSLGLQSCGGGGGGSDGGGSGPAPRLTLSPTSVSVAAVPGELAPTAEVTLTVSNPPTAGLYLQAGYSAIGLESIDFVPTSQTQGTIHLRFKGPGSLNNGSYQDTIEVHVCTDNACNDDISGSPQTIQTAYVVSGDGPASATVSRTDITLTADHREGIGRSEPLTITLNSLPPSGIHLDTTRSSNAIQSVGVGATGLITDMTVYFAAGDELNVGTYNDFVTVKLCYDESCVRQVGGSPFTISTTFNVTLGIEPGLSSLQFLSRASLGHDVIDAEFSAAMNAIVTVGSYPQNAIYVYDVANGVESAQLLGKPPTAVSVSPDGLTAAVGHDASISVVDLSAVGDAGAPAPAVLNVGIPVHDLALDGNGHVYAVPIHEQGDTIRSVDIATNTEQQTPGFVERIRMQPGAQYLYGAPAMVPSELNKWDVSSGVASFLYSWQYFSEHTSCMDFWFNESGDRIYTVCGETFSANADPAQDLIYAGTIPLTGAATSLDTRIRSLSHSAAGNEIALIEWDSFDCAIGPPYGPCYTRLAYFDDALYNRTAIYGIGPVTIGGAPYAQRGRYVFHDGQSSRKLLISELEAPPGEDQRFWIGVIQ